MAESLPPLTLRQKALYTVGDIADGIESTVINTFVFFYLTAAVGMSGTLAGLAVGITMVVNAITDPVIGYVSDNTRSRWGRRHPWIVGGALPLALSLGLLFSIPAFDSSAVLFGYTLCVLITLRVSFSVFVLPYSALTPELSRDYVERSSVMTWRNFFNICGTLICIALGFGLFLSGDNGLTDRSAYVAFGWVCAAILLVTAWASAFGSLGMRDRLYAIAAESRSAWQRLPSELGRLLRNRSFRLLFLNVLLFWIGLSTAENLTVHALRYFWELPADVVKQLMLAKSAGLVLGVGVCALIAQRIEKHHLMMGSLLLIALAHFIPATLALLGAMPAPGFALHFALGAIYLLIGSQYTTLAVAFGSMVADAVDEHDLLHRQRREGLYLSCLTFSGKGALGMGALLAGVSLDLVKFPSDLAANPDQVLATTTRTWLGLIQGPLAALLMFASVAVLLAYRIDRKAHQHIQQELMRRWQEKAGAG